MLLQFILILTNFDVFFKNTDVVLKIQTWTVFEF